MAAARMRRVDEAVRAVLSEAISLGLSDPRVGFVTVTAVKTSPDLRHARVYVSVLGDDAERNASLLALRSAHGLLQARIASSLRLKHTPTLAFELDESVVRGMRISRLIDQLGEGGGPVERAAGEPREQPATRRRSSLHGGGDGGQR
jgi:ribosome-binding factor A